MPRPKPPPRAATPPRRASRKTAQASCIEVAPSARACTRRSGSTLRTAVMDSPATSGEAMIVWGKTEGDCDRQRAAAHLQREQNDAAQSGIAGEDKPQGLSQRCPEIIHPNRT